MPSTDHEKIREYQRRYYEKNKEKVNERNRIAYHTNGGAEKFRARYEKDREKILARSKAYNANNREWKQDQRLLRTFNITNADYEAMLALQGGVCAICKTKNPGGKGPDRFKVDHDHSVPAGQPGRLRSLLCHWCNLAIGALRDDPTIMRAAADYIEGHRTNPIPWPVRPYKMRRVRKRKVATP